MLKTLFQIIGFVVVVLVILALVLCYLDGKNLLGGALSDFISDLKSALNKVHLSLLAFLQKSGIAEDAANKLSEEADRLREKASPDDAEPLPASVSGNGVAGDNLRATAPAETEESVKIIIVTPSP